MWVAFKQINKFIFCVFNDAVSTSRYIVYTSDWFVFSDMRYLSITASLRPSVRPEVFYSAQGSVRCDTYTFGPWLMLRFAGRSTMKCQCGIIRWLQDTSEPSPQISAYCSVWRFRNEISGSRNKVLKLVEEMSNLNGFYDGLLHFGLIVMDFACPTALRKHTFRRQIVFPPSGESVHQVMI